MNTSTSTPIIKEYSDLKVAVLAAGLSTGIHGGAERLYDGLINGLREIGCHAKMISVPADERSFDEIVDNYDRCSAMDLSEFDVVISTKAPTYAVNHPCHVIYLIHTVRVYDDMFYETFTDATLEHFIQRTKLHDLDFQAMSKITARFAIGQEVANRLYRWQGIKSEVLHPPLGIEGFSCGELGDYFFLPGRLHSWKRVDLVIDAVKSSSMPLKLIIAGTGEAEADLKLRAAQDPRIEFLGRVSDKVLMNLYANALAVPFVPKREDYGYVTLEAFSSGKAVVTCSDSGEPTYFVKHHENGLICNPNPKSLCEALEWLYAHRDEARSMGQKGERIISGMSWSNAAKQLIDAAIDSSSKKSMDTTKVAVLDMQPITPPVGGGRLRLLGLYHNLGEELDCQYIGSYDWLGENYRKQQLTPGLEEVVVPLSNEHHAAAQALSAQVGGKTVIDISFGRLGNLSPEYIEAARQAIRMADLVIFSHPWTFPLFATDLTQGQVVIYDSQNVEGYLRAQLLDETNKVEAELLSLVVQAEYDLGCRADLILVCSQEDLMRFNRVYEFPFEKMRVIPNGVMAFSGLLFDNNLKMQARKYLKLADDRLVALFIGSPYGPNLEAGKFILDCLADHLPEVTFVIAGGVGDQMSSKKPNVIITGLIDEDEKIRWLSASDIAVNPMFSGSGTNIKMFDFMAMKLPTVTTAIGARGIETGGRNVMLIVEPTAEAFVAAIGKLADKELRNNIGEEARLCVEEGYAWERISRLAGDIFKNRNYFAGQPDPVFSVVIPTYERHNQLEKLIDSLQKQIECDFEVIVVDQSKVRWAAANNDYGFPLIYHHSPVKGAVRARNSGAALARGGVIAFTDDDCLPKKDWLINARRYFLDKSIVGIEGAIVSDHLEESEWRPVTNIGFEGVGFMTANLLVRSSTFQQLGGFDLQFDKPHFREDTDFGWRMLELGLVPYANDVTVFHPAQHRSIKRESYEERAKYFEKDVLLYIKYPNRYRELFEQERHYKFTPGFSQSLKQGFEKSGVPMPHWMQEKL